MKMTRKESDLLYRAATVAMNSGEIQPPRSGEPDESPPDPDDELMSKLFDELDMEPIWIDEDQVIFPDDE